MASYLKAFLSGLVIILFGWWVNQSFIPTFMPFLVNTPAGGVLSVLASVVLWGIIYLLFWKHERDIKNSVG